MKTLFILALISVFFSTDILAATKSNNLFNKKIDKKSLDSKLLSKDFDKKYELLCKFEKCRVIHK